MAILKKYRIYIIVILSLAVIALISSLLYTNIPRLSYSYSEEYNGYLVTNAYGMSEEYYIPANYKEHKVVGIAERAFYEHRNLKRVVFEDNKNLKIIRRCAFSYCESLESIDTGNAKYLELSAFSYCTNLKEVKTNAISIGGSAFFKCENLKSIEMTNTKYIGSMAFAYTTLDVIYLPETVTKVGVDAFYMCSENTKIQASIKLLDNNYLRNLTNVEFY